MSTRTGCAQRVERQAVARVARRGHHRRQRRCSRPDHVARTPRPDRCASRARARSRRHAAPSGSAPSRASGATMPVRPPSSAVMLVSVARSSVDERAHHRRRRTRTPGRRRRRARMAGSASRCSTMSLAVTPAGSVPSQLHAQHRRHRHAHRAGRRRHWPCRWCRRRTRRSPARRCAACASRCPPPPGPAARSARPSSRARCRRRCCRRPARLRRRSACGASAVRAAATKSRCAWHMRAHVGQQPGLQVRRALVHVRGVVLEHDDAAGSCSCSVGAERRVAACAPPCPCSTRG